MTSGHETALADPPAREALRALATRDPVLGAAMARVPAYPQMPLPPLRRSHFDALARAIVYQQLANAAAATIHRRVCSLTTGAGFPSPSELLTLPQEKLRGAGLSRNKLRALRDLAQRVADRTLDLRVIDKEPDDEIVRRLVTIWGVGEWTAQMFLLFRLGRLDVMPAGDLGIRKGIQRLDGLAHRPSPREVRDRATPWHPLCSVASWVLWRLCDEAPA